MTPLLQQHQQQGATLTTDRQAVLRFGTTSPDLSQLQTAIANGCLLYDQSHWGLLQFTGEDHKRYLHNQSTNQIQQQQTGQSCETVLVNSTARTIDLATVHLLEDQLWLTVSPSKKDFLLTWFDRFLFPMDKVTIHDLTGQYNILALIGKDVQTLLENCFDLDLQAFPAGGHQWLTVHDQPILCATGNNLKLPGYTLYIPQAIAVDIWQKIIEKNAIPIGETAWEQLRIHQGRPIPDHELTDDYNPLEAGLWDCISFNKGCYIGQETIARLNTYKGVKQRLFGIQLTGAVTVPCKIFVGEERAGVITSIDPETNFALGYIRTQSGGVGLEITTGDVTGKVVAVPYVKHEYPEF